MRRVIENGGEGRPLGRIPGRRGRLAKHGLPGEGAQPNASQEFAESVYIAWKVLMVTCVVQNRPPELPELDLARQWGADLAGRGIGLSQALDTAGRVVDVLWDVTGEPLAEDGMEVLVDGFPAAEGLSLRELAEKRHGFNEPWWRYREVRQTVADAVGEGHRARHAGDAPADHAAEADALAGRLMDVFLGCLQEGRTPTCQEREPTRCYSKRVRAAYKEADAILDHTVATLVDGLRKWVDLAAAQAAADDPGSDVEAWSAEPHRVVELLEARLRDDMGFPRRRRKDAVAHLPRHPFCELAHDLVGVGVGVGVLVLVVVHPPPHLSGEASGTGALGHGLGLVRGDPSCKGTVQLREDALDLDVELPERVAALPCPEPLLGRRLDEGPDDLLPLGHAAGPCGFQQVIDRVAGQAEVCGAGGQGQLARPGRIARQDAHVLLEGRQVPCQENVERVVDESPWRSRVEARRM